MEAISNKKIEAIYPLTFMQQSLLMHSLKEHQDQGFLQVKCTLKGHLEVDVLRQAWQNISNLHGSLKSSLHWEKLENPVQVVHSKIETPWEVHHWEELESSTQQNKIKEFLKADQARGLNLSKPPLSRISIIRLNNLEHLMIWSCHHIVLDGWSSAIILKNLFACYQELIQGNAYHPDPVPSYQSYLNWLKQMDQLSTKGFWMRYLDGYKESASISTNNINSNQSEPNFNDISVNLDAALTKKLKDTLAKHRVTINTLFLGIWSLLIAKYTGKDDIVFGTTASGRSGELSGLERMAGLFTNVLPVRLRLNPKNTLQQFFEAIQKQQAESSKFESTSLNQIISWLSWPGYAAFFDSLVVIENFPWGDFKSGDLEISNFESGFTTTYPANLVVKAGTKLEIVLRFDSSRINLSLANWLINEMESVLNAFVNTNPSSIADLSKQITHAPTDPPKTAKNGSASSTRKLAPHVAVEHSNILPPTNPLELQLTKIWEEILGIHPIGINDNFFEIGGKSLHAVRLFSQIQQQLNKNLSPSMLLQYPTIHLLAKVWNDDDSHANWNSLVPMRTSGSKPPLFAIHAGGGHVFFYLELSKHLDANQPVYTLQPIGLDGEEQKHESIEKMAAHYLEVIKAVVPEGPFAILGTCLSDPICVEINNQMREMGGISTGFIYRRFFPNSFVSKEESPPLHGNPNKKI